MKQTLFITGTDTGVGKTVLTALLTACLRSQGARVAALKPVCSGGREDARILQAALGGDLGLDAINPWHFRAPIAPVLAAGREKKRVTLAAVLAHIRRVRNNFDVVLIEGAGGLLSPLGVDFNSRDLLAAIGATPVIVAPNRLGAVNHLLLTLEALPARLRPAARLVLMAPPVPDSASSSNAGLLKKLEEKNLYLLPWLGDNFPLSAAWQRPAVRRTLNHLAGRPAFALRPPARPAKISAGRDLPSRAFADKNLACNSPSSRPASAILHG